MYSEQLDYFALAYHAHSFSVAAGKVPMSTQGLTKAIQKLESELGVSLFTQDSCGARVPTPYADELMRFVKIYSQSHDHLFERFERIRAQEHHTIRLGASLGIMGMLGDTFIEGFHARYPDLHVIYNEFPDAVCEAGLRAESYDLALTLAPYSEGMATTPLYSSDVWFWVNRANSLSNKKRLILSDLEDQIIVIPGKDFKCYHSIIGSCEEQGIKPKNVVPSSEIFWIYEFVLNGRGVGFSVDHLVALALFRQSDSVIALPLENMSWNFGLSYLSQHRLSEEEQFFYDYCVEYCQKIKRFSAP
jgi:DNA-binding transcriptional LysR family regulator